MNRLLGVLVILFSYNSIQAQDTLGLAHAIAIGLSNNFSVRIEQLNVEIAKANNTWGQAGRLPTITLSGNQNNSVIQRQPANPFAVPGRNIVDNLNGQLDVQFVLFDGFAVRMTKQRLQQLEQLSYGNATFVMETTLQAVMEAYYQALLEKERLSILQKNMILSKERYDYIKLRKELGGAITFDVLQEQNNYLTDSANVLLQKIVYKNAMRLLNLTINEDLQKEYILIDSLEYRHETYEFDDLMTKMVSSNTNLRNQYINQEIQRTNTRLQQAAMSPTLSLNVGATGSLDRLNAAFRTPTGNTITNQVGTVNGDPNQPVFNTVNETALITQTQTGDSYGGYGNLSLRFTLFNGGQIKRAIENAKVQEKIASLGTQQLKMSLENDLRANYDLYNLRSQLVNIALIKQQAAELNLSLANERYRNGALSAIDLRIVQENARNAALEAYLAIFNSLSTKLGLVRLTGGLIDNSRGN